MNITHVAVYIPDSIRGADNVMAFVNVEIDAAIVIQGIRLIRRPSGPILAMPCRRRPDGTYQDTVFPICQAARDALTAAVLDAYRAAVEVEVAS